MKFSTRSVTTVHNGTESIAFLAPKIWKIVPENKKACVSMVEFKTKIPNWIQTNCHWRNLGFV